MVTARGFVEGITVLIIGIGTFGVTYPLLSNALNTSGLVQTGDPLLVLFLTICIVIVAILGSFAFFFKVLNNGN